MFLVALHHCSLSLVTCSGQVTDYLMLGNKDANIAKETKITSLLVKESDGGDAAREGEEEG